MKRVKNCLVCGENRCTENDWIVYCFRYQKAYNKKNLQQNIGVGVLRDIVPEQGLGQRPMKELAKEARKKDLFSDEELPFFGH